MKRPCVRGRCAGALTVVALVMVACIAWVRVAIVLAAVHRCEIEHGGEADPTCLP